MVKKNNERKLGKDLKEQVVTQVIYLHIRRPYKTEINGANSGEENISAV